jgi:cysteine desulfurase/selenocysteine lyase
MIYLDNAAASWPKPEVVYQTLGDFLRSTGASPGRLAHRMAMEAARAVEETRNKLARLLGMTDAWRIVFTASATDALNLAIKGVLSPNDHAVTTVMEHNSVRRPLRALEAIGVAMTKVPADGEGFIDPAAVRAALRPNTRLVAVTHASNVNGAVQPIREVADIVHEHGALLLVDGAQTVGALPFTLADLDADLLAFSGYRALLGPPGTGALVIGPRVDPSELSPLREGSTGVNSERDVQPQELPYRYEAGMLNTVGIAALGAALDFLNQVGIDRVAAHQRALTDRLVRGLRGIPGVRVLSPDDPDRRVAVVSFVVEGWNPADLGAVLDQTYGIACRAGLHCAPDACRALGVFPQGTVRFSPGFFTTEQEIDQAIAAVHELARTPLHLA